MAGLLGVVRQGTVQRWWPALALVVLSWKTCATCAVSSDYALVCVILEATGQWKDCDRAAVAARYEAAEARTWPQQRPIRLTLQVRGCRAPQVLSCHRVRTLGCSSGNACGSCFCRLQRLAEVIQQAAQRAGVVG